MKVDLKYVESLYTKKKLLKKEFEEKLIEIEKEIDKYKPKSRHLKKGDVVYDHDLNTYKIVAVNKETYRLDNGTTLEKDTLNNWRGWGWEHPDWQYYYDKEHRDLLDFFDEQHEKCSVRLLSKEDFE